MGQEQNAHPPMARDAFKRVVWVGLKRMKYFSSRQSLKTLKNQKQ